MFLKKFATNIPMYTGIKNNGGYSKLNSIYGVDPVDIFPAYVAYIVRSNWSTNE
jgi:hypothetical protein